MGYDYLYEQAAEAQSPRYYCSAQRHTRVDFYRRCCAADQNTLITEEEKVEKYQDLALEIKKNPQSHESDSNTHRD